MGTKTPSPLWSLVAPAIAIMLAFSSVGFLAGFLVGNSQSPVVSAIIPLIVGLLAALTYGFLDGKSPWEKVAGYLKKMTDEGKLTGEELAKIQAAIPDKKASLAVAGFWAISVICFCIFCFLGTHVGVEWRVPTYPSLDILLKDTQPTNEERALLSKLRSHLVATQMPATDVQDVYERIVKPILREKDDVKPLQPPPQIFTADNVFPQNVHSRFVYLKRVVQPLFESDKLMPMAIMDKKL
jgi:hypothetical protein